MARAAGTPKAYDLGERCFRFARDVYAYVDELPRTISSFENGKQLVRSAGSVGANYVEANDSLSRKDCVMRMKISKKEAKESQFWLRLTQPKKGQEAEKDRLAQESLELAKIFGAIIKKLG